MIAITRRWLTPLAAMLLPSGLKPLVLNCLGHRVGRRVRIGFSLILSERLWLADDAAIGSLNLIRCRRLVLRSGASIQTGNVIRGPLTVLLRDEACIGNRNVVTRAGTPTSFGSSSLVLGRRSKITASHFVDCMNRVTIGDDSILAGKGTQIWTHGYIHVRVENSVRRDRVEGPVHLGDAVYVGAMCYIGAGVSIADDVTVGSHTAVAKSLLEPGLYVSQGLRYIPTAAGERASAHAVDTEASRVELVRKKPNGAQSARSAALPGATSDKEFHQP